MAATFNPRKALDALLPTFRNDLDALRERLSADLASYPTDTRLTAYGRERATIETRALLAEIDRRTMSPAQLALVAVLRASLRQEA